MFSKVTFSLRSLVMFVLVFCVALVVWLKTGIPCYFSSIRIEDRVSLVVTDPQGIQTPYEIYYYGSDYPRLLLIDENQSPPLESSGWLGKKVYGFSVQRLLDQKCLVLFRETGSSELTDYMIATKEAKTIFESVAGNPPAEHLLLELLSRGQNEQEKSGDIPGGKKEGQATLTD